MSELDKLQRLSLVTKVTTELENHVGIGDSDLAEFIIALSEESSTVSCLAMSARLVAAALF
jgi:ATP-dependent RNA helicase DHX8/PRP22